MVLKVIVSFVILKFIIAQGEEVSGDDKYMGKVSISLEFIPAEMMEAGLENHEGGLDY